MAKVLKLKKTRKNKITSALTDGKYKKKFFLFQTCLLIGYGCNHKLWQALTDYIFLFGNAFLLLLFKFACCYI